MVEVIHQWPSLKYPEMAILKIVGVTAVLFLAGLLPWVDNYAHLFGFIFGFLLSYALQPYVTFGVFDKKRKVILVWICFASCLFLFVGLLLLFYVTPIHDCEVCKYFNCIPITKDFCADQNINLDAQVWYVFPHKQTNKNKTSKNITKRILRGYAATPEVALPENQKKICWSKKKSKKIPTVHHHHQ